MRNGPRRGTRGEDPEMTILAFQSAIMLLLILLNGPFAMSESALASARKAGLRQRVDAGDTGRAPL